jgi:hypothetical protein
MQIKITIFPYLLFATIISPIQNLKNAVYLLFRTTGNKMATGKNIDIKVKQALLDIFSI